MITTPPYPHPQVSQICHRMKSEQLIVQNQLIGFKSRGDLKWNWTYCQSTIVTLAKKKNSNRLHSQQHSNLWLRSSWLNSLCELPVNSIGFEVSLNSFWSPIPFNKAEKTSEMRAYTLLKPLFQIFHIILSFTFFVQ